MSTYTKTTWNSGAAPGINADKLNKLETQYDCAKDDLDDHVAAADPHGQYLKEVDEYIGPTVQQDVTASRAVDTVYQNTTGKPMWVAVTVRPQKVEGGGSVSYYIRTDGDNPPVTQVAQAGRPLVANESGSIYTTMTVVVLPGYYYQLFADVTGSITPAVTRWFEWY
jgi:hypothetical protein